MKKIINTMTANGWTIIEQTETSIRFKSSDGTVVDIVREGFDDFFVSEYEVNGCNDHYPNQTLEDIEFAYCS